MSLTAQAAQVARLEAQAKEAIKQYNDEVAGGAEPLFPDWALDMLAVLDQRDKLAGALALYVKLTNNDTLHVLNAGRPKLIDCLTRANAALATAGVRC